jgi:hypothetical protein
VDGSPSLGRRRRLLACFVALAAVLALPAAAGAAGAASAWSVRELPPKQLEGGGKDAVAYFGVSCPSETLCVAVGSLDSVAVSRSPTGGAGSWHVGYPTYPVPDPSCLEEEGVYPASCSYPRGALDAVSCASESLCVAVTYEGSAFVSTDPAAGAGTWSIGEVMSKGSAHLTDVSCPSAGLCVAVSGGNGAGTGKVFTATAPAAGNWSAAPLPGAPDLRGVSCSSPAQCVAVAKGGRIFTSTNPTGGAGAWREVGSPTGRDLEALACVSGLCAAGDGGGNVLTSTDPTGAADFALTGGGGSVQLTGLSCPTADRCVAVDNNGSVLTSTNPTGGTGAWTFENLVPFEAEPQDFGQFVKNALWGASCPSPRLCVLVGANSRVFTATEPFAKPPASSPGTDGGGSPGKGKHARKRPRTHLVFAEHFWKGSIAHHGTTGASFHFYSRDGARGFECKRDHGRWRPCHSPLRYRAKVGSHTLRVRAIGPTGLRGPIASLRFKVYAPHHR